MVFGLLRFSGLVDLENNAFVIMSRHWIICNDQVCLIWSGFVEP